jgi:acyl-CoA hydrolase
MEIRVEVESKDPATDRFYPLIIATFTMVATFEGKVRHGTQRTHDMTNDTTRHDQRHDQRHDTTRHDQQHYTPDKRLSGAWWSSGGTGQQARPADRARETAL